MQDNTCSTKNKNFCRCKCGTEIPFKDRNRHPQYYVKGHGYRKAIGDKHRCWKGGRRINSSGYILIYSRGHPKADANHYVREHILVMEKMIGRHLDKNECVHHKDENRQNNDISNLQLMTRAEHMKYHMTKKSLSKVSC